LLQQVSILITNSSVFGLHYLYSLLFSFILYSIALWLVHSNIHF
jgi:hypothetical protein